MQIQIQKQTSRVRRKRHVRKKVFGTPERPRLSVYRSNKHIYAQLVDDVAGLTLASMNTKCKVLRDQLAKTGNKDAAKMVGVALAKQAVQVGIKCVTFDRNGYRFHGRIKALADGARETGLVF
ncbi:MAG: 50S ribosomal protein L18 [Planctomycetes bacterium GWC2_49_10]|nr:MAG: 50S ribosomal protein L18 [Planctomycetes bacterium GWC2_49_10]